MQKWLQQHRAMVLLRQRRNEDDRVAGRDWQVSGWFAVQRVGGKRDGAGWMRLLLGSAVSQGRSS